MGITLNEFKEGGSLRKFVTKVGLLDKLEDPNFDQEELLARLTESVTISSRDEIVEAEQSEETPVTPDEETPVTPDEGDTTPDEPQVIEEEATWAYVNNEDSWNESYANGALKDYYAANPSEDLWNATEGRAANFNDRVYDALIDGEAAQLQATWGETAQKVTNLSTNEELYIPMSAEIDGTTSYEMFTDEAMTASAVKSVVLNSFSYPSCTPSYQGAENAPGSTLPWIVITIPKGFNGTVKCDYKGEISYPWGEEYKDFNGGYGIVPKSQIAPSGTFAKTKLKVYLVHTA